MSRSKFIQKEVAAGIARGVSQCVVVGSQLPLEGAFDRCSAEAARLFVLNDAKAFSSPASFVPAQFGWEPLKKALNDCPFNQEQVSLFVWLSSAGQSTVESALANLAFISSLPSGSGVVLNYREERPGISPPGSTALDALASGIRLAGGAFKYLIQPQAVVAMLRDLGFRTIVDFALGERLPGEHLVSAVV